MSDELRDELPDDLDTSGFVGPYQFPDNSRRRWPGVIYLVVAAICVDTAAMLAAISFCLLWGLLPSSSNLKTLRNSTRLDSTRHLHS